MNTIMRIGDRIVFRGRIGYIVDIVNPKAKREHIRYYVDCMGLRWSLLESQLVRKFIHDLVTG